MEQLEKITNSLLESYENVGGINNIDGANLPSKRAVATICQDLLQLFFPGFHDEEAIHSRHLHRVTAFRVRNIADHLSDEICKSLRLNNPKCPKPEAEKLVCHFLKRLHAIRELLRTDVEAAYDGDPAAKNYDEIIVAYPFLEAVAIQRSAHCLYLKGIPLIPRIMTEWAHSRTGIDIHPGAQIGSHFFIDHGTGVVIGETCVIGSHVKLYHGVTLGAKSFRKDAKGHVVKGGKRHPTVEENVTIYPNATILGGETVIGKNSTIGGNVTLMHSVPPDSLIVHEEARLKILDKSERNDPAMEDYVI